MWCKDPFVLGSTVLFFFAALLHRVGAAKATQKTDPTKGWPDIKSLLLPWKRLRRDKLDAAGNVHVSKLGEYMVDGTPFMFQHPRTKRFFVFCLCEKVGSTEWKNLLIRLLSPPIFDDLLDPRNNLNPHSGIMLNLISSPGAFGPLLKNENVTRIMFTRNPYSRVLSGYIEKVELGNDTRFYDGFHNKSEGFPGFMNYITVMNTIKWRRINDHFRPLTTKCNIKNSDLTYDYYFPVEQMHLWYVPLIKLLNMEEEVSTGWDFSTWWHKSTNPCYYKLPHVHDCDEMHQLLYDYQKAAAHFEQYRQNQQSLLLSQSHRASNTSWVPRQRMNNVCETHFNNGSWIDEHFPDISISSNDVGNANDVAVDHSYSSTLSRSHSHFSSDQDGVTSSQSQARHNKHADSLVNAYYVTNVTVDRVNRYYCSDFGLFRYPIWVRGSFDGYLHNISNLVDYSLSVP